MIRLVSRTVLFDPGISHSTFNVETLSAIDDILITHAHPDHMDVLRIQLLQKRFPRVRIIAPADSQLTLIGAGIRNVQVEASEGVRLFVSLHETILPYAQVDAPQEYGFHVLDTLSHPGDSHSFEETMPVLALPVCAPRGSTVNAVRVALKLKPRVVVPIHDWHPEACRQMYARLQPRV